MDVLSLYTVMNLMDIKNLISVDPDSDMPKYLQVSDGVIHAIEQRKLVKGDQLPSLRQLSNQLGISFDTAKKAYDVLKKRNIVVAAHGKSNVINATGPLPAFNIFLLFNKLGSHKRILYDAFTQAFTSHVLIDLHVYNNNLHLFRHLLKSKKAGYSHCVIIPHLADDQGEVSEIIDGSLAGEKLILLDKKIEGIKTTHACVHEDFENDIFNALAEARPVLSKYKKLNLIIPEESYYPPEIQKGFNTFGKNFDFPVYTRTGLPEPSAIKKGEVFITHADEDLASLIQHIRKRKLRIGKDVGIISYNETPLKEVLLQGITTISTDFKKMGRLAAQMVMSNSTERIPVPFKLTLRPSL